jgi:hypothetical protein
MFPSLTLASLLVGAGLGPSPAWMAESDQANSAFGTSVATAGDVNGDGFSDVIAGAPKHDQGETDEGLVLLFLGSLTGPGTTPAWMAESNLAASSFGTCVAPAGDINGDGYADILIGAPTTTNGQSEEGRAYLYLGSSSGPSAGPSWTAESNQTGAMFGTAVATAGDVNGDGYADVVVGAPQYDNGQADEGRASLYLGSASGLVAMPAWSAESNQAGARFGVSVSTAGDVNGDGYDDVIVGASHYDNGQVDEGRAYLYLGSAGGLAPAPAWMAESSQSFAVFGFSVATAGDTNADGYADVIIGSDGFDNGEAEEGRAFVYFGTASGLAPNPVWTAESNQLGARFGWSVAPAGDVDGDGFADVIVGAIRFDTPGVDGGKAFVYMGSRAGPEIAFEWSAESEQVGAQFGFSVATAGDSNSDGFSDVIVGAPGLDNGQTDEGGAFIYLGSGAPPSVQLAWSAQSNQADAHLGTAVGTAGDVNGDGFSDVIVGAPSYTNGQADEGRTYVHLGAAGGLSGTPAWIGEPNVAEAGYGFAAGTAGDVNGDGYSDVIVGAPTFNVSSVDEGRLYVYHGSPGGLGVAPAWIKNGDESDAELGHAVGTAGDVNGDGYSDVIASAHLYTNGQLNEGRAYVYLGTPFGLPMTPVWTRELNLAGAFFGSSLGTAGDVNGDGYSDIIVGAYGIDNGLTDEGRAYVYLGSPSGPAVAAAWIDEGDQAFANYGYSVSTAGDVNGDGYADVIVGAWLFDNGLNDQGRAFVYLGSPTGLGTSPAWTADGDQANCGFGWWVSTAGDVNDDGYSDVMVAAHRYSNGQQSEGRVYVYLGSATGLESAPAWFVESDQANSEFGRSLGAAGDVNGDGFCDVIAGAWNYDAGQSNEGWAAVWLGNERLAADAHLTLRPRQRRLAGGPIDLLGFSDGNAFRLEARGRSAAGRARVRLEWNVAEVPDPLPASPAEGNWADTGLPILGQGSAVTMTATLAGLAQQTPHHWRLRIAADSPFFPHTPWLAPAPSVRSLMHLRTGEGLLSAGDPDDAPAASGLRIEAASPNPFSPRVTITYVVPTAGRARLAIYDAGGRLVATLADSWTEPGSRHVASWDGLNERGERAATGVYFARLQAGSASHTWKVTLTR